jgi:hypothetical protein
LFLAAIDSTDPFWGEAVKKMHVIGPIIDSADAKFGLCMVAIPWRHESNEADVPHSEKTLTVQ